MIPARITKSLHSGPSPVILPSAHTACSQTFICSDDRRDINTGTAPIKEMSWKSTHTITVLYVYCMCTVLYCTCTVCYMYIVTTSNFFCGTCILI